MNPPTDRRPDASADRPAAQVREPGAGANAVAALHRPVFLDLTRIQMPVGALTSIGHRISGVVLVASVPIAVYLLGLSLCDEAGFAQVAALSTRLGVKAAVVIGVWALAHHVLGGVRHLLSDFDIGSSLRAARRSAWFVNLAGVAVALLAAGVVW
jgi:succinate dehydrogenase / fumarate reductase cytochrome b subunit